MQHPVFLRNDELILLHDCFLAGNTQAKFVIGAFNYFLLEKTTMGKQMLHEANKEGETNAQYGLAIALICEFNDNGKQLLLSILNQPNGKHLLQNCRRILRHTTLGTKNSVYPTNKNAIRRELVIGTVIFHTHMEMMNYMSNARCVQSTWKFIN